MFGSSRSCLLFEKKNNVNTNINTNSTMMIIWPALLNSLKFSIFISSSAVLPSNQLSVIQITAKLHSSDCIKSILFAIL